MKITRVTFKNTVEFDIDVILLLIFKKFNAFLRLNFLNFKLIDYI